MEELNEMIAKQNTGLVDGVIGLVNIEITRDFQEHLFSFQFASPIQTVMCLIAYSILVY